MRSRILKLLSLCGLVACCVSMLLAMPDTADAQSYRMECSNGSCRLVPTGTTYTVPTYATPAYSAPAYSSVTTYSSPAYFAPTYVSPARPAYSYGVTVGVYRAPAYYAPRMYAPPRYYAARPAYVGMASISTCGNPLCGCVNCPCGPSCACGY